MNPTPDRMTYTFSAPIIRLVTMRGGKMWGIECQISDQDISTLSDGQLSEFFLVPCVQKLREALNEHNADSRI